MKTDGLGSFLSMIRVRLLMDANYALQICARYCKQNLSGQKGNKFLLKKIIACLGLQWEIKFADYSL